MANELSYIMHSSEAELFVEALEKFDLKDVGSPKWAQQHEHIEKLNMQAVLSASQQQEEFVKEYLISLDKVNVLIHELIVTDLWKKKIFPEFVNLDLQPGVIFPMYMVLYHEATVSNLLETSLFHEDVAECAEDTVLDLIDYCYEKLINLINRSQEKYYELEAVTSINQVPGKDISSLEELQSLDKKLDFDICTKAVSIIRYITDHLSVLPLSATTRLLNTHDLPIFLVELVENSPWIRENGNKLLKYIDNKWEPVHHMDRFKLTKLEGQVWLTLFQLLMSADCQKKYELNPQRKNSILKLRSHLTEVMLDQLPVLGDMLRYLEQLAIMDPPPIKTDLILEQMPEIKESYVQRYDNKWASVAKKQSKTFFNPSKIDMKEQAKRLAATYNFDMLDTVMEPPKCAMCGERATKRCSRCQNEWYCRSAGIVLIHQNLKYKDGPRTGRVDDSSVLEFIEECQVGHWKKHKKACNLLVDAEEKIKAQNQELSTTPQVTS